MRETRLGRSDDADNYRDGLFDCEDPGCAASMACNDGTDIDEAGDEDGDDEDTGEDTATTDGSTPDDDGSLDGPSEDSSASESIPPRTLDLWSTAAMKS